MRVLPVLFLALTPLVACSSDTGSAGRADVATSGGAGDTTVPPPTLPPTECAAGDGDPSRTVVVDVDDLVGGFGRFGTRTPSDLTAGLVRIAVDADAENAGPEDVAVSLDGAAVVTISGVAPGTVCAVDVDLAPGHYVVVNRTRDGGFDVIAAPAP